METIEITAVDIAGAGHGNWNDPLVRALNRVTGGSWRSEVLYSSGARMEQGATWDEAGIGYVIDAATTHALQEFDQSFVFAPRTCFLDEE